MQSPNLILIPASHASTLKNALGSAIERWTKCAISAAEMGSVEIAAQFQEQIDSAWAMIRAADEVSA